MDCGCHLRDSALAACNWASGIMLERRREQRHRSFLGGKLSFNHRQSVIDCLVRNISESGALIEFPDTTLAPADFELHVRQRDRSFRGTVVWRKQARAGVVLAAFQFEDVAISLDDVRRQKALKKENKALRKQLDYMT